MSHHIQQKRQIIDCTQHQHHKEQEQGIQNNQINSQINSITTKSQSEQYQSQFNQSNPTYKDPIHRVKLYPSLKQQQQNQQFQQKLNNKLQDIKTPNNEQFKEINSSESLKKQILSQELQQIQQGQMNNNLKEIQQPIFNDILSTQQSQSNKNISKENQSADSISRPFKFSSLGNIDSQDPIQSNHNNQGISKRNNSSQDSQCIIKSNKGRYLIHQRTKIISESNNIIPPNFFTTPQHNSSKTHTYQLEKIPLNTQGENKKSGIIYSNTNNTLQQNQYKINMKNDKIFASFVPCFSFSPPIFNHQIPEINTNYDNIHINKKPSTTQNQVRSSTVLEKINDYNQNLKYSYNINNNNQPRSNSNMEQQRKKIKSQSEIQDRFDLLNNLFSSNTLVQGKSLNNDQNKQKNSTIGFNQQNESSQQKESNLKYNIGNVSEHYFVKSKESNEILMKLNNKIDNTIQSIKNIDQSDRFAQFSTEMGTDLPDTSSSQDDANNSQNKKLSQHQNTNIIIPSNKYDNKNNMIKYIPTNLNYSTNIIDANKMQITKQYNNNQSKVLNKLGSLSFLDEADNNNNNSHNNNNNSNINNNNNNTSMNNNQNFQTKKYMAASFTKLPSTCQLGKLQRKSMNTLNKIKTISDIQNNTIREPFVVDENKMLEDYRQFQLRNKLDIKSKSVSVYDVDNQTFILSVKGEKQSQIASLTKIMTCYIVCDLLNKTIFKKNDPIKVTLKQNQIVKISKISAKMKGTSALLKSGDELTLWSLLHGLMLPSGNDAAFAISEHVGSIFYESTPVFKSKQYSNTNIQSCNPKSGQKEFIRIMNLYADKMKLKNTYYSNPHGLSNNKNKSSANDLCILIHHAMKNSYFRQIVKTKEYTTTIQNYSRGCGGSRDITWENTNKLLKSSIYCTGVKTGVTPAAGPCLASAFTINNRNFIIVLLKVPTMEMRFSQTMSIFKFIVEIYELNKIKNTIDKSDQPLQSLNYLPDQNNIIEKKYIKKGWEINSTNNIVSANDIDQDKYTSGDEDDDDDIGDDEDNFDEDGYSSTFDCEATIKQSNQNDDDDYDEDIEQTYSLQKINSNNSISNKIAKDKEQQYPSINNNIQNSNKEIQNRINSIDKLGQDDQNQISNQQSQKFEELLKNSIISMNESTQLKLLQLNQNQKINNSQDENNNLLQINEDLINSYRRKRLSKINEEDS